MSSLMDKYLKEMQETYNSLVSQQAESSQQTGSSDPTAVTQKTEAPELTGPKPKSTNVTPWKGSMNMPYDPDVDDIEDWRWK